MSRSIRQVVVGLVIVAGMLALAYPTQAQIVTISARSVDSLVADFKYLAPLFGEEELARVVDGYLRKKTGSLKIKGVDGRRPAGLLAYWSAKTTDLWSFDTDDVYLVPVADEKLFLEFLKQLGCNPRQQNGSLIRLTVPGGPELYLRFAHRYAFAAEKSDMIKGPLADPVSVLARESDKSTLQATLHVDRFPKDYRKVIDRTFAPLAEMFLQMAGDAKKQPRETEAQYRERVEQLKRVKALPEQIKETVAKLIAQTSKVSFELEIDRHAHRLGLELAVVPRPKTGLASFAAYAGTARSKFSHLTDGAMLSLLVNFPPSQTARKPPDLAALSQGFGQFLELGNYQETAAKLLRIVAKTLVVDGLDFCFTIRRGAPTEPVILAGLKVQDGRKLDYLLRDTYKMMTAADKRKVPAQWNHARHGRAKIHKFTINGAKGNLLAIRDDVVFFSDGTQGLKLIREALDNFDKIASHPPTPLVEFRASAASLANLDDKKITETMKTIPRSMQDKMQVRVSLEGGKDLRLRVEVDTHLLKLIRLLVPD